MPIIEKKRLKEAFTSLDIYCTVHFLLNFLFWQPCHFVCLPVCLSLSYMEGGMTLQSSLSCFGQNPSGSHRLLLHCLLLHRLLLHCWPLPLSQSLAPLSLDLSLQFQHFNPFLAALSPQHSLLISGLITAASSSPATQRKARHQWLT